MFYSYWNGKAIPHESDVFPEARQALHYRRDRFTWTNEIFLSRSQAFIEERSKKTNEPEKTTAQKAAIQNTWQNEKEAPIQKKWILKWYKQTHRKWLKIKGELNLIFIDDFEVKAR